MLSTNTLPLLLHVSMLALAFIPTESQMADSEIWITEHLID